MPRIGEDGRCRHKLDSRVAAEEGVRAQPTVEDHHEAGPAKQGENGEAVLGEEAVRRREWRGDPAPQGSSNAFKDPQQDVLDERRCRPDGLRSYSEQAGSRSRNAAPAPPTSRRPWQCPEGSGGNVSTQLSQVTEDPLGRTPKGNYSLTERAATDPDFRCRSVVLIRRWISSVGPSNDQVPSSAARPKRRTRRLDAFSNSVMQIV
jgi:hypothetical protein